MPRGDRLPTVWKMKPHTEAKHRILRGYLGGWFPILNARNGRIIYLDGFAGPGVYESGEPGSPMVALDRLLTHNHFAKMTGDFLFIFNENDADRFASLAAEVSRLETQNPTPRNVRISLVNQGFGMFANDLVAPLENAQRSLAPTFAFIDPFGYKDVSMSTIGRLLNYERCELLIYFDINSVVRFATGGVVDQRFEELFGTDEFKNAPPSGEERQVWLADLYERQLRQAARFRYTHRFLMLGENGKPISYLIYCTRNLKGLRLMKQVMWGEANGPGYSFHDRLANQDVLLRIDLNPDPETLAHIIALEFSNRSVDSQEVKDWVIVDTPYVDKHTTAALKYLQSSGQVWVDGQRRRFTFPPGVLLNFPAIG